MSSSPHSLVVFSIVERQFALDIAAVKSVHRSVEKHPRVRRLQGRLRHRWSRGDHRPEKNEFDLLVSDVDRPRLDGFGLTSKVRADAALTELPAVLVSSMASREFQERGIEAGANAYIVKSSFDQSNLLDIIRKLL